MPLVLDQTNALQTLGLTTSGLNAALTKADPGLDALVNTLKGTSLPAFTITRDESDFKDIEEQAKRLSQFDHVVCVGMGGSSLGAMLLAHFASGLKPAKGLPQLHFADNPDPYTLETLIRTLPLKKTGVLGVSKSGGTIETLVIVQLLLAAMEKAGADIAKQTLFITEPGTGALSRLASAYNVPVMAHDPAIGGRYTLFSNVGLIPGKLAGLDIAALRAGGAAVLSAFMESPQSHHASQAAACAVAAATLRKGVEVLMPYTDRLRMLAPWWAQLWAESLGKEGLGTTPVAALGATDQHSQLQLYMDGPADKLITFIVPDFKGAEGPAVSAKMARHIGTHLAGLTPGRLLAAQAQGTAEALHHAGKPTRTLHLGTLTGSAGAAELGGLAMHLMLSTVVAAGLWRINAFDQPAVEDSKKRTLAILSQTAAA